MSKGAFKILVVEDDSDIQELIEIILLKEGYQVQLAENGKIGFDMAKRYQPDLILMDVMMPVVGGIEACKNLKENKSTKHIPVVFLTARSEEMAEIEGFAAGGDDYIAKPIRSKVLTTRINAILRRLHKTTAAQNFKLGDHTLIIDREKFVVVFDNQSMQWPRKEFELLEYLASQPYRVFTREEILSTVWGNDVYVVERTVDVHIRKIREKLKDLFIHTVKGIGYKFEAESA